MSTRREFIKSISRTTYAIGSSLLLVQLLQSCTAIRYVPGKIEDNQIRVNKSEFIEQQFVIVTNKSLSAPIYVVKDKKEDTYEAFIMTCTHLGCELKPTGAFLTCACHGSEFSNHGKVLQGPASKPLPAYQIVTMEEEIIIELNKIKKS
ncbi:MAG: Rieske (2Fe-2S) protein [Crocinitomicaceae bacterium]|nr:Rieske (2Fe-2S) protein [Crocinitomicaceae bacterium]